jgi:hypothetical protein
MTPLTLRLESGAVFKHKATVVLFDAAFGVSTPIRSYDISPDGQRFIFFGRLNEPPKMLTEIQIISNWFAELKRRVPVSRNE